MAGWNSLPVELRQIIVENIRQTLATRIPYAPTLGRQNLPLPLVCREWQWYFSHVNFGVVFLDQDRLDDFRRYVSENRPRREHVRLVVLCVKLPEYDCAQCHTGEDEATSRGNDVVLRDAMEKFMGIMSDWSVSDGLPKGDIELDLGALSPSDRRHDVRHSQKIPGAVCSRPRQEPMCCGRDPLMGLKRRLAAALGDPEAKHFAEIWRRSRFASAPVLGRLVIRRQHYRYFSPAVLGKLVAEGLPNLAQFRHETWAHPDRDVHLRRRREYLAVIQALPPTIRSYHLFCDSNALFRVGSSAEPSRADALELGNALAAAATRLEVLTASFVIEAGIFLARSSSGHLHYPLLKKLVLTSPFLSRAALSADVLPALSLVLAAATSAQRHMPSLAFLDVWYAEDGDAFLVRFVRGRRPGTLFVCWFSTWHGEGDEMRPLFGVLGMMWRAREPQPGNRLVCRRAPFTAVSGSGWHATGYEELAACILHLKSRREIKEEFGFYEHEEE